MFALAEPRNPVRWAACVSAVVALVALIAYARSLTLPPISDDYVQIDLGRRFGSVDRWLALSQDALYRCRATSILITHWTEELFGPAWPAYRTTSLVLHVINSLLVFALGHWRAIGWRVSAIAAIVFAGSQGHQEAVIWYAALPELLVFTFVLSGVQCWIRVVQDGSRLAYIGAMLSGLLALASKESGGVLAPLLILVLIIERRREAGIYIMAAPLWIAAAGYFWIGYTNRSTHLHYNDGTFSLQAPFWVILVRSTIRMLWPAGLAALIMLWRWSKGANFKLLAASAGIGCIGMLPYCFLTYMPHIPSRHTYIPSAGVALIIAAAILTVHDRFPRTILAHGLLLVIVLGDIGYLWTRKHRQYVERAEPTERVVREAMRSDRPVSPECFPYGLEVAVLAVRMRTGKSLAAPGMPASAIQTVDFCRKREIPSPGTM